MDPKSSLGGPILISRTGMGMTSSHAWQANGIHSDKLWQRIGVKDDAVDYL